MNAADLIQAAAKLPPARARQVLAIAAAHARTEHCPKCGSPFAPDAQPEIAMGAVQCPHCGAHLDSTTGELLPLHAARAAFEKDMQPVCAAIVGALQAGDLDALHGLRALLPHLLAEVNESPALADVLAQQLGESLLTGLGAGPEDVL